MEQVKFKLRQNMWGHDEEVALIKDAFIMGGDRRNFSGKKTGGFNQPGVRYFNICFSDPTVAQKLADHKYNVKFKNYDGTEYAYLKVGVNPDNGLPCMVYLCHDDEKELLNPEDFDILDGIAVDSEMNQYKDTIITSANLTLRLYEYREGQYSAQLEEGRFYVRGISEWDDDQFDNEEF